MKRGGWRVRGRSAAQNAAGEIAKSVSPEPATTAPPAAHGEGRQDPARAPATKGWQLESPAGAVVQVAAGWWCYHLDRAGRHRRSLIAVVEKIAAVHPGRRAALAPAAVVVAGDQRDWHRRGAKKRLGAPRLGGMHHVAQPDHFTRLVVGHEREAQFDLVVAPDGQQVAARRWRLAA